MISSFQQDPVLSVAVVRVFSDRERKMRQLHAGLAFGDAVLYHLVDRTFGAAIS
jgi:hypothetical protein